MKLMVNLGPKEDRWLRRGMQTALVLRPILDALVKANRRFLRAHNVPGIYESGVRYANEPPGTTEEFAAIPIVLARKWGDCDDLAPWRVAELQEQGERASIRIQWKPMKNGRKMFHVLVRRENGSIEDPSALLGMYELQR